MRRIFVFGSNLAGRHGKGAALDAVRKHGAIRGQGEGLQGDSYALPTKDEKLQPLPLDRIWWHVVEFLLFAEERSDLEFHLTNVGCGLAGYNPEQIAPMFAEVPANVILTPEFYRVLEEDSPLILV